MPTPSKRTTGAAAPRTGSQESSRTATKKTAARRTTAKKTAARSTGARSTSRDASVRRSQSEESRTSREPSGTSSGRPSPATVARHAMEQLADLTGKPPESITAVARSEDGWTVEVEVVESRRIPDSTDILATYEVEVDPDGELTGYHRIRRYARGRTGDE